MTERNWQPAPSYYPQNPYREETFRVDLSKLYASYGGDRGYYDKTTHQFHDYLDSFKNSLSRGRPVIKYEEFTLGGIMFADITFGKLQGAYDGWENSQGWMYKL